MQDVTEKAKLGEATVRVLYREVLDAVRLERKSKAFFILYLPLGSPDDSAEAFLTGWEEGKHAAPAIVGEAIPQGLSTPQMRVYAREKLQTYVETRFASLLALAGEREVTWSLDCPGGAWGKCLASARHIRLNPALCWMPTEVIDEVILHELNHLRCPTHNRAFWERLTGMERDWPRWEGILRSTKEGMRHVFPV